MKDVTKIHYKECKYTIKRACLIFPDGTTHELDPMRELVDLSLEKSFDDYQYPFMEMWLSVSSALNRKMRKYNDNLKLELVMRYGLFQKGTVSIEEKNVIEYPFINDTFYMYMDDASTYTADPYAKEIENKTQYGSDSDDVNHDNDDSMVRFLCYREETLTEPKQVFADVLRDVTLSDVVAYMIKKLKLKTKILMSPSTNGKKYMQFIIPPLRMDENIDRICNDYAIHDHGTMMFFDFDRLYLIDKVNKCTAWEPKEEKVVYVVSIPPTANANYATGAYKDAEDNEIYLTMKVSSIQSASVESSQLVGTGIQVINKRLNTVEYYKVNRDGLKKVPNEIQYSRTMVINTGAEGTINAIKERLTEQSLVWQVYLDSTMIAALKPNREFKFVFTDTTQTKYNGSYRLTGFEASFSKAGNDGDGKWWTVNTIASFAGLTTNK